MRLWGIAAVLAVCTVTSTAGEVRVVDGSGGLRTDVRVGYSIDGAEGLKAIDLGPGRFAFEDQGGSKLRLQVDGIGASAGEHAV